MPSFLASPRWRRLLRFAGYGAFYLFALLVFAYVTFPYQRLRDRIVQEFNARQTGPEAMRLEIDELDSYWFSGVEAEGVRLITPPPAAAQSGTEQTAAPKPSVMEIASVRARAGLLGLLIGSVRLSFAADAFGGSVTGFTTESDGTRRLELELEELALAEAPMLAAAVGLPLGGTLNGELEFVLPEGKLAKSDGTVNMVIEGLSVGDGKAKIQNTIALPKVEAGTLTLTGAVTAGQLKIGKFESSGPHLEFAADGSARLRDPAQSTILSMTARFRFTDRYKTQNDLTKSLFGAPGSSMPGLFDLDPKNKRAKRPDGFYGWRVSGTLGSPTFAPNPTVGGALSTKAGRAAEPL